jgi:hypothetical protein
VGNATLQAAFK